MGTAEPSFRTAQFRTAQFRTAQWRILLATMFCYLFFYTGRQTFGFAIPGIQEELGIGKATLGWAGTCLLWSYALGQSINGNLGDKYGGRRIVSFGAVASCVANWAVSFGSSVGALLVPWAANGYFQAMGWAPGSRVLSNWWSQSERGRVYGLYVFAAGMSSVVSFVTSLLVIDTFNLDWRWIFRLPVLLLLVGGCVYFILVRDRPEDVGWDPPDPLPDTPGTQAQPADPSSEEGSRERYVQVFSNPRFMIASVAIGFQNLARYGLLFWVPVHFLGADWKNSDDKWVSLALPIGMALGPLASGWLSDRVFRGLRWPLISLFMFLAALSAFGMYFIPRSNHGLGICVLFLCGFFAYGPQSAFWALCPDLLGPKRAGTGTGIMNFFAYLFAGVGEPVIGRLIESNQVISSTGEMVDDTGIAFLAVTVACLASGATGLLIRR